MPDLEADHGERLDALEARSLAGPRVISAAARSVVFLQGAYGFVESETNRPLRVVLGPDGAPLRGPAGHPVVAVSGEGPIYERQFTGTAFVAADGGLLLTNRHLAEPWDFDDSAWRLQAQGWLPIMQRFIGYLPEVAEPFDVRLVTAAESADVAVLCCSPETDDLRPLELDDSLPEPGEEVFVLSYPAGIQALLARTDPAFVEAVMRDRGRNFWSVARRLAEEGHVAPLATNGIVGQASASTVVYDAETTRGSSGGPVLGVDGKVTAVNVAILREFGGSNLGVPISRVRPVLDLAALSRESESR